MGAFVRAHVGAPFIMPPAQHLISRATRVLDMKKRAKSFEGGSAGAGTSEVHPYDM